MRKFPISAVSISALLLATAACGNPDDAYETSENETAEEEAGRTAPDGSEPADEYADAAPNGVGDPAATAEPDPYSTEPAYKTASVTASKTRAEIERLATDAFESADTDQDGVIDREEYVQLALASARDFDTFVAEPAKLMSVNPATDPEGSPIDVDDSAETVGETPTGQPTTTQPTMTAESATELDATETAEIEIAASGTFDEAAGVDAEMTAEELRNAFLARFEEADEDGDDQLNASELRTFAALTRGATE